MYVLLLFKSAFAYLELSLFLFAKTKSKKSTAKLSYANFRALSFLLSKAEHERAKVRVAELCSDRASTVINSLG